MSNYRPLTSNPGDGAALLVDASQPFSVLNECAEYRLYTVKNLMNALACLNISGASGKDISSIAEAAYLLLEEACDLLKAASIAAEREGHRDD